MAHALETQIRGDGPPVLLLHSGGMSSRQWKKLADQLAPSHRVVLPDFLGSGANPPWPADKPFHFELDVDATLAILERVGPAHVVGHSYGGFVGAMLLLRRPDLVRTFAAYDPVAFGVLHEPRDPEGLADLERVGEPRFTDETTGGDERWFELFVDYWNGPGTWPNLAPPAREGFLRVGRKVFFEVMTLLADRTPARAYAGIEVPALLLTGEKTPTAGRRVCEVLAETLPRARLERVATAGHMGPITHADAVNSRIVEHLARS